MNMNIDFFAQMFAEASPLLQNSSSSTANTQFISPNPNTCVSLNQTNSGFTSNTTGLSGVDILDFIPAAAVAEQQQLQQSQQYLQQSQQSQQYLQTPKSAISSKFQFSGGSNFSNNPTPSFGTIPSFPVNSHDSIITSTSFPVTAQFSPITPNIMNSGSQLNLESYEIHPQQPQQPQPLPQPHLHQQQTIVEQTSSTPSSMQGLSNSPLQFSPQQSRFNSASRVSSSNTSVADKSSPTIGLGVSVSEPSLQNQQVPTPGIMNITNKQPSPHEQAALQFQQQLNHEAHKSSLSNKYVNNTFYSAASASASAVAAGTTAAAITTSTSSSSKLQSQSNVQLQKLIEQQREKQQEQLLLLKKGEIPKPPELKPKRKSSCRPHKQKKRIQQQQEEQQQQLPEQQSQSLKKIPSPPLQPITGDSPTTIEVASPESDVNNELNFSNNTSTFMFGAGGGGGGGGTGNITAEEFLNNDPFEALDANTSLIDCKNDILSEFIDFEYEETIAGDFEKSITKDDFNFLKLNNQDTPIATTTSVQSSLSSSASASASASTSSSSSSSSSSSRPALKKKKSVVSSSSIGNATTNTGSKVSKRNLKKSSSFNGVSPPTFIMNPKLQWIKTQTNDQQILKSMKRSVSNGNPPSLGNEDNNNDIVQSMPIFTLSNHYSFVYETVDTIYQDDSNEDNSNQTTPRKQQQQQQQQQNNSNNNNNTNNNSRFNEGELLKNLESGLGEFKLDLSKRK